MRKCLKRIRRCCFQEFCQLKIVHFCHKKRNLKGCFGRSTLGTCKQVWQLTEAQNGVGGGGGDANVRQSLSELTQTQQGEKSPIHNQEL